MANRKTPAVEVLPPVAETAEPSGPFVYVSFATVSKHGAQGFGHRAISGLSDITTREHLRLVADLVKEGDPSVEIVNVLFWRALEA